MTGESLPGVLLVAAILAVLIWRANRKAERLADVDAVEDRYESSGFAPTGLTCHPECAMAATLIEIRSLPEVQR